MGWVGKDLRDDPVPQLLFRDPGLQVVGMGSLHCAAPKQSWGCTQTAWRGVCPKGSAALCLHPSTSVVIVETKSAPAMAEIEPFPTGVCVRICQRK